MASVNFKATRPALGPRSTAPKTVTVGKNPAFTHITKTTLNDMHHQNSSASDTKVSVAKQNSGGSVHNGLPPKSMTPASGVTVKKPVARQRSGSGAKLGEATKQGPVSSASKTTISKQGSGDKMPNGNSSKRDSISGLSKPTAAKRGSGDGAKSGNPVPTNHGPPAGVTPTVAKQGTGSRMHNGSSTRPLSATSAARVAIPRKASSDGSLNRDTCKPGSNSSSPRNSISGRRSGDTPSVSQRKPIPLPRSVNDEQKMGLKSQTPCKTSTHQTATAAKPIATTRQTLATAAKSSVSTESIGSESKKIPQSSSLAAEESDVPVAEPLRGGIMRKAASEKRERDVTVKFTKKSSSVKTSPIHKAEATLRIMLAQSASSSSARLASRASHHTSASQLHGVTRTTSKEKIDPGSPQSSSPRTPTKPRSPITLASEVRKISTSSSRSQTSISEEEAGPPPTPTSPTPAPSPVIDLFAEKQELIEPVDYEEHILKNRNIINNDPLRSLISFPYDDVSASTLPRQLRTTKSTVPERALQEASSLFVKESINSYMTEWKVINNKYNSYGGQFQDVPGYQKELPPHMLREQVYEVDDVEENQEATMNSPSGNIHMQGFLYKTPFGQQAGLIRAYKRRYFYLRQLADKSFLIEYHKDEKSHAAKGNLPLDSLVDVIKTTKQRKFGMELLMQDRSVQSIAAENQQQMDEWYSALKKVLELQKQDANVDKQSVSSMEDLLDQEEYADSGDSSLDKANSKKKEKNKHPELQGYGKETEKSNSQKRKENRNNVFLLYPRMQGGEKVMTEPDCKPYEEDFGKRFAVDFQRLVFKLSAALGKDGEPIESGSDRAENVEPFFTSMSLFDVRNNRKISEDFHIDLNSQVIRALLDKYRDLPNGSSATEPGAERRQMSTLPNIDGLDENWLKYPQKAIFSVKEPHPEIYLVIRIEKVLQGGITQCTEPYVKTGDVLKSCQKVMKQAKMFCSRMGQYRMPFAWTARRVFNDYSELDLTGEFFPIYRQESSKLSNEDLLKQLQDVHKNPEKLSKLTEIPGYLKATVEPLTRMLSNCLTSSLIPAMPWPDPPIVPPTLEVEEFLPEKGALSQPFTTYTNNLYVYPVQLKYDSQKTFTKARNIALCVEFRDSDDEGAQPLKAIYGRPGGPIFVTSGSAAVLHHHQVPDFYEEIKIALPTQLHDKHHLLFRFYHVSCEVGKGTVKKRDTVDSFVEPLEVGYAWIPLLDGGKPNWGDLSVCVSSNLPGNYLGTKGATKPELKLVDGGKQLLKVHIRLASTIYTTAQHLHNFFVSCEAWEGKSPGALQVIQYIKAMHAVDTDSLIKFLPVILNQLFRILPMAVMDEVQLNVVRLIIFIVSQVHKDGREDVLHSYVKYVFETEKETALQKTVHEELVKNLAMSLRPSTDQQVIKNLMKHMWFFFNIIIKSMAQHLIQGDGLKQARIKRFSTNFETGLRNLVQVLMPHILQKQDVRQRQDAKDANFHLANFIKRCFTYMDRGFVFRLINCYMGFFSSDDAKPVFEMKFEMIRVVCSYEHYIALNLPLQKKGQQQGKNFKSTSGSAVASVQIRPAKEQYKDLHYDYQLTEEYCQQHFLTGLLLREVGSALHDVTEVRQNGIRVLRNLLAKHSFDNRYSSKQYQARIAALYLPLISIILENAPRLAREAPPTPGSASVNGENLFDMSSLSTSSLLTDSPVIDRHNSVSTAASKTKSLQRDSAVLDMIAGRAHSFSVGTSGIKTMGVRHSTSIPALPNQHVRRMSAGGLSEISSGSTRSISEVSRSDRGSSKSDRSSTRSDRSSLRANRLSWMGMSDTLRSLHLTLPGLSSSQTHLSPVSSSPGDASPRRFRKQNPLSQVGKGDHGSPATSLEGTPLISTPRPLEQVERTGSSGSLSSSGSGFPFASAANGGGPGSAPSSAHTSVLSDSSERSESQSTLMGGTAAPGAGKGHQRSKSTIMYDKLMEHEIKDLLVCLLFIVKNVNEEVLLGWWSKAGEDDHIKLFDVLEMCLYQFQYKGKKHIIAARLREKPTSHVEEKSKTLPAARARAVQTRSLHGELPVVTAMAEAEGGPRVLQEANLGAEVGLIVLDVLGTYCTHFKPNLDMDDGDNPLMRKVMDIFLSFIKIGQSETLSRHVFASLRSLVHKFPVALFKGSAQLCGDLCLSTLKCLNSKLPSLRSEACALLYLIMKENYEFTTRKDFVRVHLQVVISVSKLIGDANSVRFQESLAMINNYAVSDKSMSMTQFPSHVKDLTKKIRTVLMATAQMKEHEKDPEMLVDLQDSLAKSYASTPELRRTWLESMAVIHINHGNYSEAAHCNIHIAALIAEYLKRKGIYPAGCQAFRDISPNIENEERGMKEDIGLEDVQYSEQTLLEQLERCAEALQKAERYESMGALYKLIIPFYEKQRDFHRLAMAYGKLCEAYKSVMKVTSSGRRLLGQYFRVAFFGQHFEEDDGKEFIYKEPKVTTLASVCERLLNLYTEKFGKENVKLIRDSSKVNPDDLDPKIAYIQLTFVKPYFDDHDLQERQTAYERNNNIRRFVYETPYTEGGKARGAVEEQCKLKTIVTTSHAFPYVKKRIQVVYQMHKKLNPIQVAIDEVKAKVQEFHDALMTDTVDMKRVQLLLQGSVSTQVNAGPQAYAIAFLGKGKEEKWEGQDVWELKKHFREFMELCGRALETNARLIKEDQHEYHEDLVQKYRAMSNLLAELLQDQIREQETPGRRVSGHFFNAISGL
ncbi:dedicator of cytokinesis protein 9-like isoform X2 [Acanthaster planci]|uniref:Dedicator of cytokinesis protein 9-like isoform X2 n=1 Tax=Acanthaster planci TaxID=133434 RepID=A0A8B7Y674_ACAPL|nr:dedicator of cytokinesis protein 9-like isoform X2 [Acanthaster planci]